ncbi:uncharacterized protein LOC112681467 [Sipha flava]|uniref:Uncharacterized protein LOC112681467 n=1 Tax=Sipha flava TaxID=143950 RepID=A0A8B8FAZ0_9HEMI|nr:uncharacterized protein LOC112681467 [Sipha flava]
MSAFEYSELTEDSSNISDLNQFKTKKIKSGKVVSYKEKLNSIVKSKKYNNLTTEFSDSIIIREAEKNYTIKCPSPAGQDYWVVQHFKTEKIANLPSQERWKHAECIIKMNLSDQKSNDININNQLQKTIEIILDRFMADPKKKMMTIKNLN